MKFFAPVTALFVAAAYAQAPAPAPADELTTTIYSTIIDYVTMISGSVVVKETSKTTEAIATSTLPVTPTSSSVAPTSTAFNSTTAVANSSVPAPTSTFFNTTTVVFSNTSVVTVSCSDDSCHKHLSTGVPVISSTAPAATSAAASESTVKAANSASLQSVPTLLSVGLGAVALALAL